MVRIGFRALVGLGTFVFGISGTVGAAARPASPPGLVGLDAEVAQALQDFKVPGVAIAVVKEGKVILAKGYGYRDLEKQLPVTTKTLFAIGSITKSFTVATLGTLVDEGRLGWDQPVHSLLPDFVLKDAWASEHVTPRDLVTHRTGLPRHDLTWYSADFSRAELVGRLRYLELSKEPRATFQYNNLMFMTAGYLAGRLQGTTWEEAVRQRILAPLGMNDSNFSVEDSQKSTDFARPYRKNTQEKATLIPYYVQGAVGRGCPSER